MQNSLHFMLNNFEIGVTYRGSKGRYYLAYDRNHLLTVVNDIVVTFIHPSSKYYVARNTSVSKLCATWNISVNRLDDISSQFFYPNSRATPRNNRRQSGRQCGNLKLNQNKLWAKYRTHRLSTTGD